MNLMLQLAKQLQVTVKSFKGSIQSIIFEITVDAEGNYASLKNLFLNIKEKNLNL